MDYYAVTYLAPKRVSFLYEGQKGSYMKFCSKCGALMLPKKEKSGMIMACGSCDHTLKTVTEEKIEVAVKHKDEIHVVAADQEDSALPTTDASCDKCNNDQAYYWVVQTRSSDEPATKFLKCTKCKHTWRDYN
ncbi:MAG: DNA-directed RNA polymerase subunit M [Candidatus Woesearchaeota archaeon]|jgi:DNA-directed RNA polymerase subunit M